MEKIQAALVGSVKPIRSDSGYDITEATIGQKAAELGITTSVRNLNQMEKRLLRIIVLMDQMRATGAMQDLARTIEQPSNQIKVLTNQLKELKTWLGNVFIGTIGKILPYINGFVMALVQIVKMLAIFVGYTNVGSGLAEGLEIADNTTNDIAAGMGSAVASAKEFKKVLMGFDVLNVIQTPTTTSGAGGADIGRIDPAILAALEDYDNLMDSVRMKAIDIRDKIMEWLGFIKIVNPLTGELSWKFTGLSDEAKIVAGIIGGLLGLRLATKLVGFIGKIRNLTTVLKTGKTTGLTPFYSGITGIKNGLVKTITWVKLGIEQFRIYTKEGLNVGTALKKTATGMYELIPISLKLAGGIAGLIASLYGAYDAARDFSEGTKSAGDAAIQLGISIGGATTAGAILGSIVPRYWNSNRCNSWSNYWIYFKYRFCRCRLSNRT